MAETLAQVLAIALVGLSLGLAANAMHPQGVTLGLAVHSAAEAGAGSCEATLNPLTLSSHEASHLCESEEVVFVDARSASAYASGHVVGAIHLPPRQGDHGDSELLSFGISPTLVVYGDNTQCDQAKRVGQRLISMGYPDIFVLEGGWPAWSTLEHPVASGSCGQCTQAY